MVTPYPDMRYYTSRDYGNRVGIFRFVKLFDELGIKASVATQVAVAKRYPSLIAELVSRDYELIGHSIDANGIQYGGMDEAVERDLITSSIAALEEASGTKVGGWHSIAKSESENTLGLLAEAGVDYVCDWVNDDLPYEMTTPNGTITAMPLSQEISDRQIIIGCHQTEDQYVEQVKDQFDTLYAESVQYGGRILALTLTPYIMGLPYRIAALKEVLEYVMGHEGCGAQQARKFTTRLRFKGQHIFCFTRQERLSASEHPIFMPLVIIGTKRVA